MKLTNKAKTSFVAMAAVTFLNAAPVMAAEIDTTNNYANNYANHIAQGEKLKGQGLGLEMNHDTNMTMNIKPGLGEKDGRLVYLNEFGQEVYGLMTIGDETFYLNENGKATGWIKDNGAWYYFNEETGARELGEILDGEGKYYILHEDGTLTKGWVQNEDGTWMCYNRDGSRKVDTSFTLDGVEYTFDENGHWVIPAIVANDAEVTPENVAEKAAAAEAAKAEAEAKAAEAAAANADRYQAIANAAIAQIGVNQDCTMLVTNALRAVGINFHGAPAKYLSLGPTTNNPVPGDIIVYQGHVAIYIGNGRAIHGGWDGYTTREWSVNCANPFVAYVHPILP